MMPNVRLACLLVPLVMIAGAGQAQEPGAPHLLAYSKTHDVRVYAETDSAGEWCGPHLELSFEVLDREEEGLFPYQTTDELMRKLGRVIDLSCKEAQSAEVYGSASIGDVLITQFSARSSEDDGWALVQIDGMADAPPDLSIDGELTRKGSRYVNLATGEILFRSEMAESGQLADGRTGDAERQAMLAELDQMRADIRRDLATNSPGDTKTSGGTTGAGDQSMASAEDDGSSSLLSSMITLKQWTPPSRGASILSPEGVFEFDIPVNGGECALRYDRIQSLTVARTLSAEASGYDCREGYLHGNGRVLIRRANGDVDGVLDGAFTQGYSTGAVAWPFPVIARTIIPTVTERGEGADSVLLAIEADASRKLNVTLAMSGRRSRWDLCRSPQIVALTDNEQLVRDAAATAGLAESLAASATRYCPEAHRVDVHVASNPYWRQSDASDPAFLAYARVSRMQGEWRADPLTVRTAVRQRELMREQERMARIDATFNARLGQWNKAKRKFTQLEDAPTRLRLAYYFGVEDFANPLLTAAQAELYGTGGHGAYLLKVDEASSGTGHASWPARLRLVESIDADKPVLAGKGWYLVYGEMQKPATAGDDIGVLAIAEGLKCEQDRCRETEDTLGLVRRAENYPDFDPDLPPDRDQVVRELEAAAEGMAGENPSEETELSAETGQGAEQ